MTFDSGEAVENFDVVVRDVTFLSDAGTTRTLDVTTGVMNANVSGDKQVSILGYQHRFLTH